MITTPNNAQRALVARLTETMTKQGMSVSALSKAAGIPRSTLHGWLSTGNPSVKGRQSIARALGTDLVQLTQGLGSVLAAPID